MYSLQFEESGEHLIVRTRLLLWARIVFSCYLAMLLLVAVLIVTSFQRNSLLSLGAGGVIGMAMGIYMGLLCLWNLRYREQLILGPRRFAASTPA